MLPDFTLAAYSTATETTVTAADCHRGTVVLYSYPKDMTPGCTTEAQDFQRLLPEFVAAGATVYGLSADSVERHAKFAAKHDLQFTLLSDPDHILLEALQMWGDKQFMGRKYKGIIRTTLLLHDGKLVQRWDQVRVKNHAAGVLEALQNHAAK